MQINAQRSGVESPLTNAGLSALSFVEGVATGAINGVRGAANAVIALPQLERENAALRGENQTLRDENERLHELAAQYAAEVAVRPVVETNPRGIEARVVAFPPENESRSVTIDRGSNAGVRKDDGVLAAGGVVGRVVAVTPFSSQVALVTDYTSRIPAITRRGRYWGIARGNLASIRVEYIPQDASIKVGDVVVTGRGRSVRSGIPIGTVTRVERGEANLYQTAILKPAVDLGSLDRVVVVPK